MADTKKCAFDDFFEGNKKPVFFKDNNHMHEDKKVEINQVNARNGDGDYDHEYTARKFSTFVKRQTVVDKGQERKSSHSEEVNHPPLFCIAVLGSSSTGKTSLCNQFSTCAHINTFEELQEEVKAGSAGYTWWTYLAPSLTV